MAVVVEELTEKVLDASHEAELRRERMQRTADELSNLIVDSLMLIHRDDVAMIEQTMQKMLHYVAAATEINARKRRQ